MINVETPDFEDTPIKRISQFNQREPSKKKRENAPLVSVIVPFYNGGYELLETLQLLLAQTLQQIEIILVDDGSTRSESRQILASLEANRDERIVIVRNDQNKGLPAARNIGVRNTISEFVAFIDGDDLLESTTLEKWYWCLLTHPNASFVNSYNVGFGAIEYLWNKGCGNYHYFLEENCLAVFSLVRKKDLLEVGGFDESFKGGMEDWDFWLKLGNHGKWGYTIPEHLTWYRRKPTHSDWVNLSDKEKFESIRDNNKIKYPDFYKNVAAYKAASTPIEFPRVNEYKKNKRKRRIMLLLPWLEMGGADKFNVDFMRELYIDHEFTIACTIPGGDNKWSHVFAKFTDDIHILFRFLNIHNYFEYIKYLIHSRKPDTVLISNSEYAYSILPALKLEFPKLPFVDFIHMEEEYWKNGGYPAMSVRAGHFLSKTFVSTQHLKQWMVNRGGIKNKISVIYTNVDAELWKPTENIIELREELRLPQDKTIIFFSGRMQPQKQPMVLAKTIEKVTQVRQDFLMVVAGDGPLFNDFRTYIAQRGLSEYFLLLGGISNELVRTYLQASDVFFLPSLQEGLALSIYEAMACAKTVVGADVGGQKELVTEKLGTLIQRSSEEQESSEYASILIDRISDPEKTKAMGEASRIRIKDHFNISKMAAEMEEAVNPETKKHLEVSRPNLIEAYSALCTQLFEAMTSSEIMWKELERQRALNHAQTQSAEHYVEMVKKLEILVQQYKNSAEQHLQTIEKYKTIAQQYKNSAEYYQNSIEQDKERAELINSKLNESKRNETWYKDELNKVIAYHENEIKKIDLWHLEQYKNIPVWVRKLFQKSSKEN